MKKLAIALTTLALASSMSATAAFADKDHDNEKHKGWYKNKYQADSKVNWEVEFDDLDKFDWAIPAIINLTKKGIIKGVDKNHFNPGGSLTRAQFSTLMTQYFALKPANPNQEDYIDVHKKDWFFYQVEATKDYMTKWKSPNGGYAFMPNKEMNRMDTAVSLVEILVHDGALQLVSQAEADQILRNYADASLIPSSLRIHVATAIKANVMKGVGSNKFNPLGTLNRAQAAQLLYNLQTQLEVPPTGTRPGDEWTEVPPNGSGSDNGGTQDITPPIVKNVTQERTITIGQSIYVKSNEKGTVFLVAKNAAVPTTKAALDNLVNLGYAKKATISQVNTNVAIATSGLAAGNYAVYAVDNSGNIAVASQSYLLVVNSISEVDITNTRTDANGTIHLNVHVTTTGVDNDTAVRVELVNQNGTSLNPVVVKSETINNNDATVDLALPAGLRNGTYKLKVTVGSVVNQDTSYTKR